jgi:probable F420-dependent oxidoreductase
VAEDSRLAEERGYDGLTADETSHEPFTRLMLAAEHTRHLGLSTGVAIAFPRAPYVMAQMAWALQGFSGGRFTLGLGTQVKGHIERRYSIPWSAPGPRLRDYIQCMRAIWDCWQNGTAPAYEGDHYRFTLQNPQSAAPPIEHPDIEILLAAVNPYNARLAGELGHGIAIHGFSTFRYTREVLVPAVHRGAERAGRDPSAVQIRGGGFILTGRDEEEVAGACDAARRRISYYGSTRSYSNVLKLHGWDDEAAHLHRLSMERKWDEMAGVVTDEMLEAFCLIGPWDALPALIREHYGGLNTHVGLTLAPQNPDEEEQLREIIAEVQTIPASDDAAGEK